MSGTTAICVPIAAEVIRPGITRETIRRWKNRRQEKGFNGGIVATKPDIRIFFRARMSDGARIMFECAVEDLC